MALTGNETLQVLGQDAKGAPAAETFQTTTQAIADLGALIAALTVVAAAGATQGAATAIPTGAVLVSVTATTSSEGVQLPTAATGKSLTILPPTTKGVQAYGNAAGQLINANTTATTAYALTSGKPVTFYAVDATHWRVTAPSSQVIGGLLTASGGQTFSGAYKEAVTTVAAAGATQGVATAIPQAAATVFVTTTTSSEGVRLPTAATGRQLTLIAPVTKGFKAYGRVAGQLINAATTATTAYAVTTGQAVTFYAVSATLWRVLPTSLNLAGALNVSGLLNVGNQMKLSFATVKATGNAVANARTVGATATFISVTATTSTEGVKLPTPSTGLQVTLSAPTAVAVLVYASAAGQSIGTGTTNTTAFKITANTSTTFTAISTLKWRVSVA